jgi:ABC-2 type transport system ATP-binding protein
VSSPAPAIDAAGLGRDQGSIRALDALDLLVPAGTMLGLLGPNGAGKTTAMLLLATLLAPTRGQARVFGYDVIRERREVRRALGLVFQEPSVDGLLTVEENLRFAAGLMGLGGAAARAAVTEAMTRTGLDAYRMRPGRQLSGGWRRLTDIARATLHRPRLLILDEPTVGLDPEHRDRLWRFLDRERRERGTTVLFSTHYLAEAETADGVVMLAHGVVVAAAAPAALIAAVGDHVLEIEGPDAATAVESLRGAGAVCQDVRTGGGYRIGITAGCDGLAIVAGAPHRLTRVVRRAATLEDVYFLRTQRQGEPERAAAAERPA